MIGPGLLPPRESVLRHRQPYPGFAVFHTSLWGPSRHDLTVDEHQALGCAQRMTFTELDELGRRHLRDARVKRGNLATCGPKSPPLAYVVGPGINAVAGGWHDATYGGWVRPGGEEVDRTSGYDREADRRAERDAERREQTLASAQDWDERVCGGAR